MNSEAAVKPDLRRDIPSVGRLVLELQAARPELPRWALLEAVRRVLTGVREEPSSVAEDSFVDALRDRAADLARRLALPHPIRVVNATGIVLHTNLGRAPLAPGAAEAVAAAARSYGNLELDLVSGKRGARGGRLAEKLCALSGASGALAVNNNAGALLLALATIARGREVVVSRGELVEIGGSFRIPEILEASGARLVEVGSTNRTHAADYRAAVGPNTALLLKVHRSNFEQRGFVAEVSLQELVAIGAEAGVPVLDDLGSATLLDLRAEGWRPETEAATRLRAGADVVCFSGDKLLGGPQAGILLTADRELARAMGAHPLARALRLDKLSLAALDWTLSAHLDERAPREIPVLRALLASDQDLEALARRLAAELEAPGTLRSAVEVRRDQSFAGGGSLPGFELPSWTLVVRPPSGPEDFAERLRLGEPPVLARIREGAVVFDVRTLLPGDEADLVKAIQAALV
ncbi:MAG: L-seryl-tRNA(Sec) selenium transferase [Myxococcota bacterium]